MADMDCESLLLDDDVAGKYSEDSDYGDICNADEDALLADIDETDFISNKSRTRSRNKFDKALEQESEDILDLGTHDVELDEEEALRKKYSSVMTVSSTTPAEPNLNMSQEKGEERETRFKQERQTTTTTKKYANIPDSLDDVVIPSNYSHNSHRNQKFNRGRGRGYYNSNHQRNKPEGKTVLINPHFKGKVNFTPNSRVHWDARQRINQNYRNQVAHAQPLIQQNYNQVNDANWNTVQNVQIQPPTQFQQFAQQHMPQQQIPQQHVSQQQIPQQQIYNQPPPIHLQQVSQQLLPTFQPPQQCFMQPLQDNFYSQQPQFNHPPPFTHPPPQFQPPVSQFSSDPTLYAQPNPIRMVSYNNSQFIVPQNSQNQLIQSYDPYVQPMFNQPTQHSNTTSSQVPSNYPSKYVDMSKSMNLYQMSNVTKRKVINPGGGIRKNKKRNQVVSKNLHEVRTVQIPDTTVKDDEDEDTKAYRKLIEQQKKKREQILQQKEARRRQAAQHETELSKQIQESIVTVPHCKLPVAVSKPVLVSNRIIQEPQPIQRLTPFNHNMFANGVRKVAPILKPSNPNIKVINVNNESNLEKQHLSSFLTNRKILAKDQSLLDTNIVLISNLADGTTAVKLRKMCVGIGDVKNLEMSPKERQATIQFNSVASAHAFFKKYQRTMLDLSMIQVTLKPMS